MILKTGFAPIVSTNSTMLILGSMPGELSLKMNQYYAHPRNAFWFIIEKLFDIKASEPYENRVARLKESPVAVWDVLKMCQRSGSLDASINAQSMVVNDFPSFFRAYPTITRIFFNGALAEKEFKKNVASSLDMPSARFEYTRLPSTSPAMASLSLEKKTLQWRLIKNVV